MRARSLITLICIQLQGTQDDWLHWMALSCLIVGTLQSLFPVSEPTVLTLVNSEHYAEAPRFSAGVSHRCGNVHIRNKTGQTIIDSCTKRLRVSNGSGLLNITGSIPQDTIADSKSGGIAVIINGHMMDSLVSLITGTGSIRMIMDNPSSLTMLTRIGYDGAAKPEMA